MPQVKLTQKDMLREALAHLGLPDEDAYDAPARQATQGDLFRQPDTIKQDEGGASELRHTGKRTP